VADALHGDGAVVADIEALALAGQDRHSTAERIAALPDFLRDYNGYRPHGGLDGDTPLGRLTRSTTS